MIARFFLFFLIMTFSFPAFSAGQSMLSRDLGCKEISTGREKDICYALAENMEWTWTGHAIISPGYRVTFITVRSVYCSLNISNKDLDALANLEKIASNKDSRLEQGASFLVRLVKAINESSEEPESSIFNPANPEFILKKGCNGKKDTGKT